MQSRETRIAEQDRLFVTNGSETCPSPELCDIRGGESYESYVHRHCADHDLGKFDDVEDAERNLGVWCLFYYAKHIQGNLSLGVGSAIEAAWEPCWEDAEILANNEFSPEDTEQNLNWDDRTFRLLPAAERTGTPVFKPWKKLTKVRGTQKTSWGLAYVTWMHLRAYFIEGNTSLRLLTISATSGHARDAYFEPLKTMWSSHETLSRLYGAERVMKSKDENGEYEVQQLCLLAPGSRGKDRLRLRWNVSNTKYSGKSAVSVMCAGIKTVTQGKRWDVVVIDDPVVIDNSETQEQREKVDRKLSDLRKQADARCFIVYFNTPLHNNDASAKIDKERGADYHIFYRPAFWTDTKTKETIYYWSKNALNEPVWPKWRVEKARFDHDFYSQIALRLDLGGATDITAHDFIRVATADAPEEIRFGLGRPLTDDERAMLEHERVEQHCWNFADTTGKAEKTVRGDRSAIVAVRIDRQINIWVTRVVYGYWTTTEEDEAIFEATQRNQPEFFEYEISGQLEKYIRKQHALLHERKSRELGRPILIPFRYVYAQTGGDFAGKKRIKKMQPLIKTGRVRILEDAGTPQDIAELIDDFVALGKKDHDDGADALSRVQPHLAVLQPDDAALEDPDEKPVVKFNEEAGTFEIPGSVLMEQVAEFMAPKTDNWGLRGRS